MININTKQFIYTVSQQQPYYKRGKMYVEIVRGTITGCDQIGASIRCDNMKEAYREAIQLRNKLKTRYKKVYIGFNSCSDLLEVQSYSKKELQKLCKTIYQKDKQAIKELYDRCLDDNDVYYYYDQAICQIAKDEKISLRKAEKLYSFDNFIKDSYSYNHFCSEFDLYGYN